MQKKKIFLAWLLAIYFKNSVLWLEGFREKRKKAYQIKNCEKKKEIVKNSVNFLAGKQKKWAAVSNQTHWPNNKDLEKKERIIEKMK